MTVEDDEVTRYRFPPLERRGLAGGLRVGQVAVLGIACVVAVVLVRAAPTPGGLFGALILAGVGLGAALVPVQGRGADEWARVLWGWLGARVSGRWHHRAEAPYLGHRWTGAEVVRDVDLPPTLDGLSLIGFPLGDDRLLGVVRDRRQRAYTAVVAASVRSFGLLGAADQQRQLAAWGRTLASASRDASCIRRVQALERTVPNEGDDLRDWLAGAGIEDVGADLRRSYEALIDRAGDVSLEHEVLLAIQVDDRRAWSIGRGSVPQGADRDTQACAALGREVRLLAARLEEADITVDGLLSPAQVARAIRLGHDPYDRRRRGSIAAPTETPFAPAASDAAWDRYRCDGAVHRTFWIAQWPRLEVGPGFLLPLMLGPTAIRSVSLVAQPIAPSRSRAAVEAAITSDEADAQVREERGFRTTARRARQQHAARRREGELASGHEELRFAGFVTVTGRDDDELEHGCEAVVQAAQQSYLDLQIMYGQQDNGFACGALPLCRGLGRGGVLDA